MTDRERIEQRVEREGLSVRAWTVTDDGDTARLGRFTVATDEAEDEGLYYGDAGELSACVVGAAEYRNQRVSFTFTPDGFDVGLEIEDLAALEPTAAGDGDEATS